MFEQEINRIIGLLKSSFIQRYWFNRDCWSKAQGLLRAAFDRSGFKYRHFVASQCDTEAVYKILKDLPETPGVIVLDDYDRATKEVYDMLTALMLKYACYDVFPREGATEHIELSIPLSWKFMIITRPGVRLPSELFQVIQRL